MAILKQISPQNSVVALLSFEGPDPYSQAGGLGVRVTELGRALAQTGYQTHLFFIGDPTLPPLETLEGGNFILHRWGQWISRYHPWGVYDGEDGKKRDFEESVPRFLVTEIVRPAASSGKITLIMGEEWHTAHAMIVASDLLSREQLRSSALLLWNANNTFGFHAVPWGTLNCVSTITTVSRYMKHLMWPIGINPLVIPNGIPSRWLASVPETLVREFQKAVSAPLILSKVGRFDPDKRWLMAVEAVAIMKGMGAAPCLIIRGGIEPHGQDVRACARSHGLSIAPVSLPNECTTPQILQALAACRGADILDLQFFVPEEFMRLMYRGSHAVLANSGREPFGLVGLEVMGSGGVAITGATGEDYAQSFQNAIVVETDDARELACYLLYLMEYPELLERLREKGRDTAREFLWDRVVDELRRKASVVALMGGVSLRDSGSKRS